MKNELLLHLKEMIFLLFNGRKNEDEEEKILHITYPEKPCYFTTAHMAVIFMYLDICDMNLRWLRKVDICIAVYSTCLSCLVHCSQLPGLPFMYGTYPLKYFFGKLSPAGKTVPSRIHTTSFHSQAYF